MDPEFWHDKWAKGETGFHRDGPNPVLTRHAAAVFSKPCRVFVPLCGKTQDIPWLLSQGHHVVGAELSELAITELFAAMGATPKTSPAGKMMRYSIPKLDIYVGNVFDLTQKDLGPIDAIYDRAALIALPGEMRRAYAKTLVELTDAAPQLLIALSYDQSKASGPPFSVTSDMIEALYSDVYTITPLDDFSIEGGIKNGLPATDHVRHLQPRP